MGRSRTLEGFDGVLSLSATLGERAMLLVLDEYRPGERQQFARKVLGEWKGKRQIPEINVKTEIIETM